MHGSKCTDADEATDPYTEMFTSVRPCSAMAYPMGQLVGVPLRTNGISSQLLL